MITRGEALTKLGEIAGVRYDRMNVPVVISLAIEKTHDDAEEHEEALEYIGIVCGFPMGTYALPAELPDVFPAFVATEKRAFEDKPIPAIGQVWDYLTNGDARGRYMVAESPRVGHFLLRRLHDREDGPEELKTANEFTDDDWVFVGTVS